MELKKINKKDRILQFQSIVDEDTLAELIKKIWEINQEDEDWKADLQNILSDCEYDIDSIEVPHIRMLLSTYGGSVYDGLALYDTIKSSKTSVDIICSGKIMSMGIIILLAAKNRVAHRNTTFMIHQIAGWAVGKLEAMEESVEECKRLQNILTDIIVNNTKITKAQMKENKKLKKDWFLTAEQALELGLIDKIIN